MRKMAGMTIAPEIPDRWWDEKALSEEEAASLLQPKAQVAQKCTGGSKKPVFLFPTKVVKGPWLWPGDRERVLREIGRAALIRHWAVAENPCPVLLPSVYPHPQTRELYLVTEALYPPPTPSKAWIIESESPSASRVGPRILQVVQRESTGVIRVSDRVAKDPSYLLRITGVWEHLIHRYLLKSGDSGLHNMIVRASDERPVGIDLDENRGEDAPEEGGWEVLLFKKPPAKALLPLLFQSIQAERTHLQGLFDELSVKINDSTTQSICKEHRLTLLDPLSRLARVKKGLLDPQ